MTTSATPPLWDQRPAPVESDALPPDGRVDALVVGGGLTGLTTALLLARAGVGVALLEARTLGSGTTGSSSAKVSLVQGTRLSRIRKLHPSRVARAYVDANHEGQSWLREFCEEHDVPLAVRPAGTYAAGEGEVAKVRQEYDALKAAGLPVRWSDALDVPFPVHGAVVLEDQFQVDPMAVVEELARQARLHGATLHEGVRVRELRQDQQDVVAELEDGGQLAAGTVVIATGAPTLTGWLAGAKVSASRSYVLALEGAAPVPGMFINAGSPTRSVRTAAPRTGPDVLLVGGSGHTVGRTRSEAAKVAELRAWAAEHFPGAVETHAWSAQDYTNHDQLPIFGVLPATRDRIHLASGYDKWGMTNAVAAARAITAGILGKPPTWAEQLWSRPASVRALGRLAALGASSGLAEVVGLAVAEHRSLPRDLPEGVGRLGREGLFPAGASRVGGRTCAVSAVCTHVGGILQWNDNEHTWDCPLHGSRFTPEGEVIEGPATKPLRKL